MQFYKKTDWQNTELFKKAWDIFKEHSLVLISSLVIIIIISSGFDFLSNFIIKMIKFNSDKGPGSMVLSFISKFLSLALNVFFTIGNTKILLMAVRKQNPEIKILFSGSEYFYTSFVTFLMLTFLTALGFVFFIVPGVILALGFIFYLFIIIDSEAGIKPLECMKVSWALTKGYKGSLFVWGLLSFLIATAGLLACCVGILIAIPVTSLSLTLIYDKLIRDALESMHEDRNYIMPDYFLKIESKL